MTLQDFSYDNSDAGIDTACIFSLFKAKLNRNCRPPHGGTDFRIKSVICLCVISPEEALRRVVRVYFCLFACQPKSRCRTKPLQDFLQ